MAKLLAIYRDEQAKLAAEATAIMDRAEVESREPTDSESEDLARLKAENEKLKASIAREEERQEFRRNLTEVRDGNQSAESANRVPQAKGFTNLGEMMKAVKDAEYNGYGSDRRLFFAGTPTGHGERTGSDGGFLVGPEMSSELMEGMYSLTRIAPLCRTLELGAGKNSVSITHVDETSRANGSRYGNVLGYWKGEADTLTASSIKFRQENQYLEKLTALTYVSDELLEDADALSSFLNDSIPEELGFKLDDALIRGTGAGMPLGILSATDLLVTVSAESAQTAATINGENLKKMYARMWPSSLNSAVWLCNQDCLPQLWSLRDANITTSQMMPSLREAPPTPFTILGRPVYPVEQCATVGTVGDILFTDWRQYRLITKGKLKSDSSIHVRYLQQETAFRFTLRINGRPIRQKSLTPFKGSNTISPFIALATRS